MHETYSKTSSIASIIDVEVVETNTSFLTFLTLGIIQVMSFYIIVVTRDLTYVLYLPFVVTDLRLVDSSGRNRLPLILFLVLPTLLLLLLSFFKALSGISALSGHFLGGSRYLSLGVVPAMIFHCSLSLDFVCGGVRRLISLEDLLIGLSYVETRS